jgi:hypothetical protein
MTIPYYNSTNIMAIYALKVKRADQIEADQCNDTVEHIE